MKTGKLLSRNEAQNGFIDAAEQSVIDRTSEGKGICAVLLQGKTQRYMIMKG